MHVELEEAHSILIDNIAPLGEEEVSLDGCLNRVASADVKAHFNLPLQTLAARDGYAICGESNPHGVFYITDNTAALKLGQAVFVETGKIIPAGATDLIPQEDVYVSSDSVELIRSGAGGYVREAGEDFKKGERILKKGSRITPGDIALLAAYGQRKVVAYRRPRVAILSLTPTAVPYYQIPSAGQTRDSNGPLLNALMKLENCEVTTVETVMDMSREEVSKLIINYSRQNDVIVTNGGTFAAGEDEARVLLESAGARILFWGTAIQPGGHNGAAMIGNIPVLCLSGNPAACAVGFHLLVSPVLRLMQGLSFDLVRSEAIINDNIPQRNNRRFLRGMTCGDINGRKVSLLPGQKPGMIRSLLNYNCLVEIPSGKEVTNEEQVCIIMTLNH